MNIDDILKLNAWTPFFDICENNTNSVMENVYEVGENIYLRTQRYNKNFEEGDIRAPFVTLAYWSPSLEGLKRIVLNDPSFCLVEPLAFLPAEISLGTNGLYSELCQKIITEDQGIAEKAIYSNKVIFVRRVISIGRFSYCFLNHDDVDERAFAIEISLLK